MQWHGTVSRGRQRHQSEMAGKGEGRVPGLSLGDGFEMALSVGGGAAQRLDQGTGRLEIPP